MFPEVDLGGIGLKTVVWHDFIDGEKVVRDQTKFRTGLSTEKNFE